MRNTKQNPKLKQQTPITVPLDLVAYYWTLFLPLASHLKLLANTNKNRYTILTNNTQNP